MRAVAAGLERRRAPARAQRGFVRRAQGVRPVRRGRRHGRPPGGRRGVEDRDRDHLRVLPDDGQRGRDLALPLRHEPQRGGEPPAHGHPGRQPPDLRAVARARASTTAWARPWSAPCSAPRSSRMYIGHVGDSRCYRVRSGQHPAAHARPLAHQRLPARDARPHGRAEAGAAEERHHPRPGDAGPGRGRPAARRPAARATSTCSAPTASPAW